MAKKKAQDGGKFFEEVNKVLPKKQRPISANLKTSGRQSTSKVDKFLSNLGEKEFTNFQIKDPRTLLAASNQKINPNRDLKSGKYNSKNIESIIGAAKHYGVDPSTLLAISLQESGLGATDSNLGHILNSDIPDEELAKYTGSLDSLKGKKGTPGYDKEYRRNSEAAKLALTFKNKMKYANDLGFNDEALQLQTYNGLGTISPNTEKSYHNKTGRGTKNFYGVDVTEPISMRENPLYGKTIIDLRENVIKKNPELLNMINMANGGKIKKKAQAGTQLNTWQDYMKSQQSPGIPDPMKELQRIQNMQVPALPVQDYGVQATDPQAALTAQLGQYPGKKKQKQQPNWGDLATGALLLTDALIPGDPIRNPVVRPQVGYSPQPQGRGSQAIAKQGKKIKYQTGGGIEQLFGAVDTMFAPIGQAKQQLLGAFTGGMPGMIPGMPAGEGMLPMMKSGGGIHIKPENKGKFTAYAKSHGKGVQEMAAHVMANKEDYSSTIVKRANFAKNAAKFKHENGGLIPISNTGYKATSKDKNKSQLRIPSNQITMQGVEHPVLGVSNLGDTQLMFPDQDYSFDGNYVDEFPLKAQNGAVVGTPQERAQATATAQRLSQKYGMMDPSNIQIGATLPQFLDAQGRPAAQTMAQQLPTTLPRHISLDQIQSEQGISYYTDPQTGYVQQVDPSVIRNKKFQKPQDQVAFDQAGLSTAKKTQNMQLSYKSGGKLKKYNLGGNTSQLTDDTVQFNGPSHSNGGIDISYAGNGVEVEGGETGFQANDGSLNIMGNMINPLTNRKFKEDSKRLAKKEQKVDALLDYSVELVNNSNPKDKWEILKFNSGSVQMQGAARKKDELQQSKQHLADLQQTMLDFSEENSIDPEAFSKGKFQKAKPNNTAQAGKKLSMAQRNNNPGNLKFAKWMTKYGAIPGEAGTDGGNFAKFPSVEQGQQAMVSLLKDKSYKNKTVYDAISRWTNNQPYKIIPEAIRDKKVSDLNPNEFTSFLNTITKGEDLKTYNWENIDTPKTATPTAPEVPFTPVDPTMFNPNTPNFPGRPGAQKVPGSEYNFDIQDPTPYTKPTDARGLSFNQILPELYTAATNQVEPVFMQEYTPQLFQDYDVSYQDQLNENQASFRAITQAAANNPAALATLAGQKYQADQQVLGNEFRANQAIEQDIVNKNISLLNDAELKNLSLADQQYTRQSKAKSNTKLQNQIVLQSISDKFKQNELENRTLQTYENLYPNFSFDENYRTEFGGPKGQELINWGGQPSTPTNAQITIKTDNKGNTQTIKKFPSTVQQELQNVKLNTEKVNYNKLFADYLNKNKK